MQIDVLTLIEDALIGGRSGDNTVTALAVLQRQNKSLVKTLEKYNKER